MATRSLPALPPTLAGLLLASAVLGFFDALVALWCNRAVAPHATLPLCLTAPFAVALLVLVPPAGLVALLGRRRAATVPSRAAALLGAAAGCVVLHVAARLGESWRASGAHVLAAILPAVALAAAVPAGLGVFLAARRLLARSGDGTVTRLVSGAALLHLLALGAVGWQVAREGRGVVPDILKRTVSGAVAADGGRSPSGTPETPRNLVLITIDTLRADHLDAVRMPRTSALAARGASFGAAFAASSWTLPALASLMTGLPVARHRAGEAVGVDPLARRPLGDAHATLATVLERAGFATRAIVTNPYLGLGYGLGRGFAAFENVTLESEAVVTLRPTTGFWLLELAWPALAITDRGDAVTRRAARFLAAPDRPERFFLWLHYVDPHAPYEGATRSFRDDLLDGGGGSALPRMAQLRAGEIRPSAHGRIAIREAYARAVRAVDTEVGTLVDLLAAHDLASRTLVAVTADHGEELWDHGGVEHGHTLYSELVRVPLVLVHPGSIRPATEVAALVGIERLAATLLDLLGVAPGAAERALGPEAGFAAALRGAAVVEHPVVSESLLFAEERVALRTARHTYVAWPNGKEELYDRSRDPRELRDLAARARLLRRHRALLAAVRGEPSRDESEHVPQDDRESQDDREPAGTGVTTATRRALQALGYVE